MTETAGGSDADGFKTGNQKQGRQADHCSEKTMSSKTKLNGAEFLVKVLENHGVTHVFGIPGAKVDSVFTALLDSPIELVVCRHEQNAAFMAQAFGRLTGRIGVCLVTSGPGVTNLVTGLATATTEGDPVLAIGGEVPLDDRYKHSRGIRST